MKNLKYVIMLIALMMVSSAFAKAETKNSSCIETVVSDWTGTWDTSFGQVILNQKNQYVVGTYRELGAIRSLTTMGTAFYGEFDNNGRVGYFKWIKSGNSFTGTWGWTVSHEQGAWTGTKTTDAAQNYIKGKWTTTYGELDFINSKTGIMVAHYGNNGGMVWGKMNHTTGIFTGKYRRKLGAVNETCSFIFKNSTFQGKFNNRAYGSWDGQRKIEINTNSTSQSNTAGEIISNTPVKFKITLNSFKCHNADNVRNRERGRVQILFGLNNSNSYSNPIDQSHYSSITSNGWYFFYKASGNQNYVEGQNRQVNNFVSHEFSNLKFRNAAIQFYFAEAVGVQMISEVKEINLPPQIIDFLTGNTEASDYPLVPGHNGRRRITNTQDSFWLETIGGKRYARGYADVKDKNRGKIHFGYHYTIELVD